MCQETFFQELSSSYHITDSEKKEQLYSLIPQRIHLQVQKDNKKLFPSRCITEVIRLSESQTHFLSQPQEMQKYPF